MADDDSNEGEESGVGGKLRQLFHNATGDREAEAKALADRAGDDVDEDAARIAVDRAHGERRDEEAEGVEVATVDDAKRAADESAD